MLLGKVYSRKKENQSSEPGINARRPMSEKSGDGSIKKFINFSMSYNNYIS